MPKSKKTTQEINLNDPQYYFSRELSWLEFNNRVLNEAIDPRTPLLERLKFIAIFCSNLDEYFMVRVAALKQQEEAKVSKLPPDGRTPTEQLELISIKTRPPVALQHQHFEQVLRPLMAAEGIHLLDYVDLNQEQRIYLQKYFEEQIFPVLTPLAVDPSHPFPYISNLSLNLAVVVKDPDTGEELFARVKVPNTLPRFVPLPKEAGVGSRSSIIENQRHIWTGVPLEQVIAHNLESLFPGMNIQEYHPFRITRNADIDVEEDEADDLLLAIEQELRKRRVGGEVVRMEMLASMPEAVRGMLIRELGLSEKDVYEVEGVLGQADLMSFMALPIPELKDPAWTPVVPPRLRRINEDGSDEKEDFFSVIRNADLMVHHPYYSFGGTVQRFITQAAHDPNVLAIKMTLYRTTGDSPILQALIIAAEKGKQVSVLVELKARFDEENNINWARKLEQAGVHVVYGLVGLKTHTKVVLVVRREEDRIHRYVHIGTGNYNAKTARIYTDLGLLSCREDLGADLTDLFNYLTGYSRQRSYRKLLVSPVNCRDRFVALIRREMEHCRDGKSGRIVAKMNSLTDPQIIATLYQASIAGVQIDLIVRGICCLRPGLEGVSENIRVVSVVGRFLEHSRIYYFHNHGKPEVYIGSADWMSRNLDRRVEAIAPIEDPDISNDLQEILGIMLADNRQAWDLQPDGKYVQRHPDGKEKEQSAQKILMDMALQI
ncbi:polyphosphate kinase 1 [Funiculus sociatus GB2-A5]|jgi:polyphosphate kinase|uniref:Polyphosphate kinase n=1 Tax=Funiculus sociatus GB2-A5 TaxID=2933946 RepID=A0ABV0JIU1_9CYAN|nr:MULTISPECIES: polyphosphate kinase 1 [unclassified Trichocoleus]MBD1904692.1 polyphosphate kinase 1 [Trichocoleus sp. FACHB-832]MBD2062490.1 polyphosphate kinase 1 [Trichocoleus sp. FACHB-6]